MANEEYSVKQIKSDSANFSEKLDFSVRMTSMPEIERLSNINLPGFKTLIIDQTVLNDLAEPENLIQSLLLPPKPFLTVEHLVFPTPKLANLFIDTIIDKNDANSEKKISELNREVWPALKTINGVDVQVYIEAHHNPLKPLPGEFQFYAGLYADVEAARRKARDKPIVR
jgi:hypothetical protein